MDASQFLVYWKVRCLNRSSKKAFDRYLVLDWSKLTPEEQNHVVELEADSNTKPAIRRYRQAFQEVGQEELCHLVSSARRSSSVSPDEYFEDEDGNPLDEIGWYQHVTGQKFPILLGNPYSVLRLGPIGISKKEQWSTKAANDIAHFLQTVRQIANSNWLKSPLSLEFVAAANNRQAFPGVKQITGFKSPAWEATRGVLMSIRLLISSDNIFNNTCNWYLKHAGDERKKGWVKEHQRLFNKRRKSATMPLSIGNYTNQRIIDTVMYGSGFVHRASTEESEAALAEALEQNGQERFVAAFHFACRTICQPAFDVYHVIKQDFDYWIGVEGCQPPDRVDMNKILGY